MTDQKISGRFQAGQSGNPAGKPKGAVNKIGKEAKEVIAQAAQELGGVQRLVDWAKEDPENEAKFWSSIYPKLIPVAVANDGEPFKVQQVKNDADELESAIAGLAARVGALGLAGGTQH